MLGTTEQEWDRVTGTFVQTDGGRRSPSDPTFAPASHRHWRSLCVGGLGGTAASQENNGFATPRNPQLGGAGGPDEKAVTAHCGASEDSSRRSASGGQSMGR